MLKLTEQECIEKIESGECFHADIEGGFQLKIEKYSFYVCTAIHDGHNLRETFRITVCWMSQNVSMKKTRLPAH